MDTTRTHFDTSPSVHNGNVRDDTGIDIDHVAQLHRSSPTSSSTLKRPRPQTDVAYHASKRIRTAPEEPSLYSDNVRKKLAATTRTGQACDRCKERKMKCDPDPIACQPCRSKNLRCYTTDRVTGQSRERGQSDRTEGEIFYLRDQVEQYRKRYGALSGDLPPTPHPDFVSLPKGQNALPTVSRRDNDVPVELNPSCTLPSPKYHGWPVSSHNNTIHKGPIDGTEVDLLDWGIVDIGDFDCDMMRDPDDTRSSYFNLSTASVLRTIYQQQKVHDNQLGLPSKAETLAMADIFLKAMGGFVPVVHTGSFVALVHQLYDAPQDVTLPEKLQVVQMLAIISHQNAIRNYAQAHKMDDSYRYLHYVLGHFLRLTQDPSLAAMQALAMVLVQFRNLPKPGYTWTIAQQLMTRAMELDYHRDPDKIELPPDQMNALAKELRKRVFHTIFGICVTTGIRMGRPGPWQFLQCDVPLPLAIRDSEISVDGLQAERSGQSEIWQCLQLAKLLPLYTELYNHILSARRHASEYIKVVEILRSKIESWRADWEKSMEHEDKNTLNVIVSTLLVDTWAAEFLLLLHHPSVCAAPTPDIEEKNLEHCHKAAKRMLSNFHTLSRKYKAADFTWHSVVAYTLGFGLTLHILYKRSGYISQEQYDAVKNELAGWMSLMAYTDLVLRTDNRLQKSFEPFMDQVLERAQHHIIKPPIFEDQTYRLTSTYTRPMIQRPEPSLKHERTSQPELDSAAPKEGREPSSCSNPHDAFTGGLPPFQNSSITIPPSSYSMYQQPSNQYPAIPTSLASLLNGPSANMSQYRGNTRFMQDTAMLFSPHLYTDATAVWPLVPEGTTYS